MANLHECSPTLALADEHLRTVQQSVDAPALVALHFPESGVGDQISAFLGALTVAIGTKRRLEILPDSPKHTSYISAAFDLPFDAAYRGDSKWVARALSWLRDEYPHLKPNTSHPARLPRLQREQWGLTVTNDFAPVAARLLVPSPSGLYPPMHVRDLVRPYEFIVGGNSGSVIFRTFFEHRKALEQHRTAAASVGRSGAKSTTPPRSTSFGPSVVSCVLRRLLRPAPAVRTLATELRPALLSVRRERSAPAVSTSTGSLGLHVRAEAHLLNRRGQAEDARYTEVSHSNEAPHGAVEQRSRRVYAADRVFSGCARRHEGSLHYELSNFSEYWYAAVAASHWWQTGDEPTN